MGSRFGMGLGFALGTEAPAGRPLLAATMRPIRASDEGAVQVEVRGQGCVFYRICGT